MTLAREIAACRAGLVGDDVSHMSDKVMVALVRLGGAGGGSRYEGCLQDEI